jgi:HrpA-like RNA helicase
MIEPEWVEAVAGDLVTREYFEPRWDAQRGEVVASERVQLYGLTLVPRRRVSIGSTRYRAKCSFARRWSRARSRPRARFSPPIGG